MIKINEEGKAVKVCTKCSRELTIDNYSKSTMYKDGLHIYCADCVHDYYIANKKNHQALMTKWRKEHKNYGKDYSKQHYKDNPDYYKNYQSNYYKKNQEVVRANRAVKDALTKGKLTKPERCECCGRKSKHLDGHHSSYDKDQRLNVKWLCRSCHKDVHGENKSK